MPREFVYSKNNSSKWSMLNSKQELNAENVSEGKDYVLNAGEDLAAVELKNKRDAQEDRIIVNQELNTKFTEIAHDEKALKEVMQKTFADAQEKVKAYRDVGATAHISIFYNNKIYTAAVGDSTGYIVTRNKITNKITVKRTNKVLHKASEISEKERLTEQKIPFLNDRIGQFTEKQKQEDGENLGNLSVSRALGDVGYEKYGMLHTPELNQIYIDEIPTNNDIEVYHIASCDGLTEVAGEFSLKDNKYIKKDESDSTLKSISDEEYIRKLFTESKLINGKQPFAMTELANELAQQAIKDGSTDNISLVVRKLDTSKTVNKPEVTVILDGHGGADVARSLSQENNIVNILQQNIDQKLNAYPKSESEFNQHLVNILKSKYKEAPYYKQAKQDQAKGYTFSNYYIARYELEFGNTQEQQAAAITISDLAKAGHQAAKFHHALSMAQGKHGVQKNIKEAAQIFATIIDELTDQEFHKQLKTVLTKEKDFAEVYTKYIDAKSITLNLALRNVADAIAMMKYNNTNLTLKNIKELLIKHKDKKEFTSNISNDDDLKKVIFDTAKNDAEAAQIILSSKQIIKSQPKILNSEQIADILAIHANNPNFMAKMFPKFQFNHPINLVELAKSDILAFSKILSSPILFKKLGDEDISKIAEYYSSKKNDDALAKIFPYTDEQLEQLLMDKTKDLHIRLAGILANEGNNAHAQFYLAKLYAIQASRGNLGGQAMQATLESAHKWANLAANNNHAEAKKWIDSLQADQNAPIAKESTQTSTLYSNYSSKN